MNDTDLSSSSVTLSNGLVLKVFLSDCFDGRSTFFLHTENGDCAGGFMAQRIELNGEHLMTVHRHVEDAYRRMGVGKAMVEFTLSLAESEGRRFVVPGTVPGSGLRTEASDEFWHKMGLLPDIENTSSIRP